MSASLPQRPIPYSPSLEQPAADEAQTIAELVETLRSISERTYEDTGHALRSVHAKSHGLLQGELKVIEPLPPELRQGLFAESRSYPVVMRLSTNPGDILPDSVSVPRGLALKVVGVAGARLPGSEDATTQDFVLVNAPAFSAPDAKTFLKSLKLLAGTTDRGTNAKKLLSAALRGAEKALEALGGESATLKFVGGHPETHPLGETFYSQAPMRYGDYVAKIAVAPSAAALTRLEDAPLNVNGRPNGLREAIVEYFARQAGEWELRVQLLTNADSMPIEDASKRWAEDESPYRTVARITVPPQSAWSDARAAAIDDGMAFSPWHGLAAHQPLGSVMRARRASYEASASFRGHRNGCPMHEPTTLGALPD